MPVLDPLIIWIAAAALAVLFAHAALAKFGDLAVFEQHLAAYRVPAAVRGAATWAVPAAEAACATALLVAPWRGVGAALAALLLLAYGAAMAWHLGQGRVLDCGCGGEPLPLSAALPARNAALLVLAAVAGAAPGARALAWPDFMVIAGAVVLATLLYAALHQVLRHAARGRAAPGLRHR